tara:strand:- start:242 stop:754 length:513 start_codon:yes stop_codon:yes gene_type:complete
MTPSVWQLLIVILFIGLPVILGLIFIRKKEYSELIENQKYAGFWNRFLAGVIDTIVLIVISLLIYAILFFTINNTETIPIIEEGISPIISFFYFILFQSSSKQGTPGMIVMKIKIYDEQFNRVGVWRLILRYFTTIWSTLFLLIGFFMIGWTKRKQGFHDIVARTIHLKN